MMQHKDFSAFDYSRPPRSACAAHGAHSPHHGPHRNPVQYTV